MLTSHTRTLYFACPSLTLCCSEVHASALHANARCLCMFCVAHQCVSQRSCLFFSHPPPLVCAWLNLFTYCILCSMYMCLCSFLPATCAQLDAQVSPTWCHLLFRSDRYSWYSLPQYLMRMVLVYSGAARTSARLVWALYLSGPYT